MKKRVLLVLGFVSWLTIGFGQSKQDPILMEIAGQPVLQSEFLQIYLKNNSNPKYDKASLDEYMELFKKFKLKVAEAEALGYDTIPKLVKELEGYKKQLSHPYLIDTDLNEELVKEAYQRMITEVRASHILVKLDPNATPADTLAAYNRIMGLKKRIEQGEDFAVVARAKNGSDDPSAATNGGDLGYFTAFQMVYSFEDMAYKTPVGKVSSPFRTRFGYHIVLVTDKRATRGSIKSAHIMVAVSKNASSTDEQAAEKKINEIYTKLEAGEKFEDLAKTFSDDHSSSVKGGELPVFGTGSPTRMVPAFEEAAFALSSNGAYSKPFKTDYGYHIVKRIELYPVRSFDEMKKELNNKVNKDERSKKTQDSFVVKLKKEYKYKDLSKTGTQWFLKNIDTSFFSGKWSATKLTTDLPIFEIDGKLYGQKDFADYLISNYRTAKREDNASLIKSMLSAWEKERILAYEETKLIVKHPEYKALVQEYHDGILLYEVMSDKVWNKGMKDTLGLKTFFEANRSKYMWGKRVDAVVYECLNEQVAKEVYSMLKRKKDKITSKDVIEKVNASSELNLRVKTNKFEIINTPYLVDREILKGLNKPYAFNGKYYVLKVAQVIEDQPKELNETRGAVTSEYQSFLEKTWLEELNKKYKVTINEQVLYSLGTAN